MKWEVRRVEDEEVGTVARVVSRTVMAVVRGSE